MPAGNDRYDSTELSTSTSIVFAVQAAVTIFLGAFLLFQVQPIISRIILPWFGGTPAVWRSRNGGRSWRRLTKGMPKRNSYYTVLRDAMTIDEMKTPALYFGTTTGQLWMGRDGGEDWRCIFDSLPPIYTVKVAII